MYEAFFCFVEKSPVNVTMGRICIVADLLFITGENIIDGRVVGTNVVKLVGMKLVLSAVNTRHYYHVMGAHSSFEELDTFDCGSRRSIRVSATDLIEFGLMSSKVSSAFPHSLCTGGNTRPSYPQDQYTLSQYHSCIGRRKFMEVPSESWSDVTI